jgi:hypothetical protein
MPWAFKAAVMVQYGCAWVPAPEFEQFAPTALLT